MSTCRCPICGTKNAGKTSGRRDYQRVGVMRDEHNRAFDLIDPKQERRLRRRREDLRWKRENNVR